MDKVRENISVCMFRHTCSLRETEEEVVRLGSLSILLVVLLLQEMSGVSLLCRLLVSAASGVSVAVPGRLSSVHMLICDFSFRTLRVATSRHTRCPCVRRSLTKVLGNRRM